MVRDVRHVTNTKSIERCACQVRNSSAQARNEGTFFGAHYETDEASPDSNKYDGMRFQVTLLYEIKFLHTDVWDSFTDAWPVTRSGSMTDMVHAPHKSGIEATKLFEKQILTKGYMLEDMESGTTDGGSENTGLSTGLHAACTAANEHYATLRCIPHLDWTVTKAGISEMGVNFKSLQAINTYLTTDITWTRLAAIASQPAAQGGLGLVVFGSAEFARVFGNAPPKAVTDRPKSVVDFLGWLNTRESMIRECVNLDHQQRNFEKKSSLTALESLTNRLDCVYRRVSYVLLRRSQYLHFKSNDARYVLASCSFKDGKAG